MQKKVQANVILYIFLDEEIMIISDKVSKKISGAETDVIHKNEVYLRYMRTLASKFAYFGWCKR